MWQKHAKRLQSQIDKTHVDQKWKTDVASEMKTEVAEHQKQVRDLKQQLNAARDCGTETSLRYSQLVTA